MIECTEDTTKGSQTARCYVEECPWGNR